MNTIKFFNSYRMDLVGKTCELGVERVSDEKIAQIVYLKYTKQMKYRERNFFVRKNGKSYASLEAAVSALKKLG